MLSLETLKSEVNDFSSASSVSHVFEVFLEVAASRNGVSEDPFVLQMFPPTYKEKGTLKEVPRFVFPCNMPA